MSVRIVNCVRRTVDILDDNRQIILSIPPSGIVARLNGYQTIAGYLNGIPIHRTVFDEVLSLPPPQQGVIYIVSTLVAIALSGVRDDVIAPNTGDSALIVKGVMAGVMGWQIFGSNSKVKGSTQNAPATRSYKFSGR